MELRRGEGRPVRRMVVVLSMLGLALPLTAQEDRRQLRIGLEADLTMPAPWESSWHHDHKIYSNILESLVALDPTSLQVHPLLARSWQWTDFNRVCLVTLRPGVPFHDGGVLSADDVVASARLFRDFEARVEAVDPLMVRFTLPNANSNFLNKLTHGRYGIASKRSVERYLALKAKNRLNEYVPAGTGPFRLVAWEKGRQLVMSSFDRYWQGRPWLNGLEYRLILDNKARLEALERGEIDLLDVILPEDLKRVQANRDLVIKSVIGMNICYLGLNTTLPPTSDKRLRRALSLAIDKLRVTTKFYYGGFGAPTDRILSAAFWGVRVAPGPSHYDPAQSKKLLTEAGYGADLALQMTHIARARPYLPDPQGVAEEIRAQLAQLGVRVEISAGKGPYHLNLQGWSNASGDPDFTFGTFLNNWRSDALLEKLRMAREVPVSDTTGRIRAYNEAQQIMLDEAPVVPLVHTNVFVVHSGKIKGVILYPSSYLCFREVMFSRP